MDAPPQSGRLLSLPDLAAQLPGLSAEGAAVRSVGRLSAVSEDEMCVTVELEGSSVELDLGLLTERVYATLRPGSLYEFLGECIMLATVRRVRVRVMRNVDGLDLELYERAARLQHDFLDAQCGV